MNEGSPPPPRRKLASTSQPRQLVLVDPFGVLSDAVGVDLVQAAAEVELHAMRQVAALVQAHPEDPVARLEDAEVGGHVRLGTRVRLDVDVLCAREQGERTLLGERLDDVHVLAAAVVALARQALGVLVREPAALRLDHRRRDVVLAGDELDVVALAPPLGDHRVPEVRIRLGQGFHARRGHSRDAHRHVDSSFGHWPRAALAGARHLAAIFPRSPDPGAAVRLGLDRMRQAGRIEDLHDPLGRDRADTEDRAPAPRCSRRRSTPGRRAPGRRRARGRRRRRAARGCPQPSAPRAGRRCSPRSSAAARPRPRAHAARGGPARAGRSSVRRRSAPSGRVTSARCGHDDGEAARPARRCEGRGRGRHPADRPPPGPRRRAAA